MGLHRGRSGWILVVVASIGAGATLGNILSPATRAHASEDPDPEVVASTDGLRGGVEQQLQVKDIVDRGGQQSMSLVALAAPTSQQLFVKHSLAIYDHEGQTAIPAVHSDKLQRDIGDGGATTFEVPEGLGNGYYFAELLTAYSSDSKDEFPTVSAQRVYFGVIDGEMRPMTTHEWTLETDNGSGSLDATSVDLTPEGNDGIVKELQQ